jgi:hypothetical protein
MGDEPSCKICWDRGMVRRAVARPGPFYVSWKMPPDRLPFAEVYSERIDYCECEKGQQLLKENTDEG